MLDLSKTRLRSNPAFRLLPADLLDDSTAGSFQGLGDDPNFYGILVPPRTSRLPPKSMSRDAALLFLTLREAACAPHLLNSVLGSQAEEKITQLILDGIFQIEYDGEFICGSQALAHFGSQVRGQPDSRIALLSMNALRYSASLEGLSVSDLASRLYMYGRKPSGPTAQRRFAADDDVLRYLLPNPATAKQLASCWVRDAGQEYWFVWYNPEKSAPYNFKLYISPDPECLPEAFGIAVDTFVRVKCARFKVGRRSYGLLRPDKLVAYFGSLEQLQEAASMVLASAGGLAPHGVPFTATIDAGGLTSWGSDPPAMQQVMPWQEHQSWRQWVTSRLAVYVVAAKESAALDVVDFVLDRVSLDGIDVRTWSPNLAIWHPYAGDDEAFQ